MELQHGKRLHQFNFNLKHMEINLKIRLPTDSSLRDFCEAYGWTPQHELTKIQFFKRELNNYVKNVIRNSSLRKLEEAKRQEVLTYTTELDAGLDTIITE